MPRANKSSFIFHIIYFCLCLRFIIQGIIKDYMHTDLNTAREGQANASKYMHSNTSN